MTPSSSSPHAEETARSLSLAERFQHVRLFSVELTSTLEPEDCVIQSMPDVSPTRWHLAHTTWFFETFVLAVRPDYLPVHPAYEVLFNSYYNTIGRQFPRPRRGMLSRPTLAEIFAYRREVDRRVLEVLSEDYSEEVRRIVELGLQHEQQHQELILTDIKHVLFQNPLLPAFRESCKPHDPAPALRWLAGPEGVAEVGHAGDAFAFDNESPRHEVLLQPYELASRVTTNAEYLEFIADGGYRRHELWLSMGWDAVCRNQWHAPLYWIADGDSWSEYTLGGVSELDGDAPVRHLSYFEADAYARWRGARLPTEFEWEVFADPSSLGGNYVDDRDWSPRFAELPTGDLGGAVWQWTSSSYAPYPGFLPATGALGEYNGKFMCNQYVLRGGSCATSRSHLRRSYRNFFPPDARWQFSGFRLARDAR